MLFLAKFAANKHQIENCIDRSSKAKETINFSLYICTTRTTTFIANAMSSSRADPMLGLNISTGLTGGI